MVLGGLDGDERELYHTMLNHFALKLQEERQRVADLQRRLDCEKERVALLESAAYGLF